MNAREALITDRCRTAEIRPGCFSILHWVPLHQPLEKSFFGVNHLRLSQWIDDTVGR